MHLPIQQEEEKSWTFGKDKIDNHKIDNHNLIDN